MVEEFSVPMLKQKTLVDAVGFMDTWFHLAVLARSSALRALWFDATRNAHLDHTLREAPLRLRDDVKERALVVLGKEDAEHLDRILKQAARNNSEMFAFITAVVDEGYGWVLGSSTVSLDQLETLAARFDTLLLVSLHALEDDPKVPVPGWIAQLIETLCDALGAHQRGVQRWMVGCQKNLPAEFFQSVEQPTEAQLAEEQSADAQATETQPAAPPEEVIEDAALTSVFEIEDLERLRAFLYEHRGIAELLMKSVDPIKTCFGEVKPHLRVVEYGADDKHVSMRIPVPSETSDLAPLQERFDDLWWRTHADEAGGGLVIRVRRV